MPSLLDRVRRNGHQDSDRKAERTMREVEQRAIDYEAQRDVSLEVLRERLLELEQATDGWSAIEGGLGGGEGAQEFSRSFIDHLMRMARIYYLKNPLIRRGTNVKADYVFGQGVNIHGRHADVDNAIQACLDDPDNRAELFGQIAMLAKEVDLECDGNVFLALFSDPSTGRLRIRTIPADEIRDIIRNPEDRRDVWYYQRTFAAQTFTPAEGLSRPTTVTAFYPDWRHRPPNKPSAIAGKAIHWDAPVYHVKIGSFSSWKFGLPEMYAALDWAKAYKEALEDDATRSKSLARFVFHLSTRGGRSAINAAKAKLASTLGVGGNPETNPPPTAGATFIGNEGVALQALNVSGAVLPPDHSRPHRLMVASATGLPDTILSGDVDQGNLATAKTLDRPTELEMNNRRMLWHDVLLDLLNYRVDQSTLAPNGMLRGGRRTKNEEGREIIELKRDPSTGEPTDRHIDVDFPPILEHSVNEQVAAVVAAATLSNAGTGVLAGTIPPKTVSRMLLVALGVADVDEVLTELYPSEDGGNWLQPPAPEAQPPAMPGDPQPPALPPGQPAQQRPGQRPAPAARATTPAQESLLEAVRELHTTVAELTLATDPSESETR